MHDYIIGTLIAIIVITQLIVALTTSKKIRLFKTVVPNINSFETVKVFIRENQIKTITTEEILNNLDRFTNGTTSSNKGIQEESEKENNHNIVTAIESMKPKKEIDEQFYEDELNLDAAVETLNETLDTAPKIEEMLWMKNGNLEEKISKSQMYLYKDLGWTEIEDEIN